VNRRPEATLAEITHAATFGFGMMNLKDRMKRIARTESPEVIAALMADMAEHIESQKVEIERLRVEQAEREQRSFNIEEKLKLIRRSLYGRSKEKRVDASDRPRTPSQSENLIFSQAMFPTNEVRNELGQTIKTRWAELDSQEIEVSVHDSEFEEEGRVRGIEKHHLEKWSDLWEEIPNAFDTVTQIEILERRYIKKIFKKKK
jgi:hypothetical protein